MKPGLGLQPKIIEILAATKRKTSPSEIARKLHVTTQQIHSSLYLMLKKRLVVLTKLNGHAQYTLAEIPPDVPVATTATRVIRLSHRNMQPPDDPLRKFTVACGASPLNDL